MHITPSSFVLLTSDFVHFEHFHVDFSVSDFGNNLGCTGSFGVLQFVFVQLGSLHFLHVTSRLCTCWAVTVVASCDDVFVQISVLYGMFEALPALVPTNGTDHCR